MSRTLSEIVRDQVLAEGPQIEDARERMVYIDQTIDAMANTELLDRISDAYQLAVMNTAVRHWL